MKKILLFLSLIVLSSAAVFVSCSKSIKDRTADLAPLAPTKEDENADTWKTILLASPTEFPVATPVATNSPAYLADINEIKGWQHNLNAEQKDIVKYWTAGAVLRWNEILRTLVAKHNLPPYQKEDGTYPFPTAANPFAYPVFPFANPPYASRAYAYVSAAQYDALVAAWYYKKLYNRPAPYKVDSSINPMVARTDLPSYPSEDAVVAGAAVEMLKLLFPADLDYINAKAAEHKLARIMAGANTRSDIEAGEALGKAVAGKFAARARTDRAGAAIGTPAIWTQFETDCIAKGETPWYSLEIPKRPPMLPLFGKVKSLSLDSLTLVSLRPGPPPAVNSDQMKKETEEIYQFIKNPTRDHTGIVHFWADGVGTYTPPGHWDAIAAEEFIKKDYSEVRWARNMALLNMAIFDAGIVCWDTKYFYFNPRPTQLNPSIKTLTGIPNFPAYISGHSTFSGAAAAVLSYLIPEKASEFDAMAKEASISRMYGGIHYRSDCEVGLVVGANVGAKLVERGKADGAGE